MTIPHPGVAPMSEMISQEGFGIEQDSPIPLYYQIRENLRDLILGNRFRPGDMIPSERELSRIYQVNRLTVRQAVTELVNEGVLRRQHGVGTFVSEPKITQTMPELKGFTDRMIQANHRPSSRLIQLQEELATERAAHPLRLPPGAPVIRLVRLRLADDEPFMLETTFLPRALFPNLKAHDLEHESLYHVMSECYGIQVVEADEIIEPVTLTAYEAETLQAGTNMLALLVEGTVYTHGRQPVEFTKSIVRGDKARYHFRIHRSGGETTSRIDP